MKEEFQNIRLIDRGGIVLVYLNMVRKYSQRRAAESGGEHSMAQKPALVILKEEEDMNR